MKKTLGWWVAQKQALEAMEATAIAELLSDDDSKRAEALSTLVSISKEPLAGADFAARIMHNNAMESLVSVLKRDKSPQESALALQLLKQLLLEDTEYVKVAIDKGLTPVLRDQLSAMLVKVLEQDGSPDSIAAPEGSGPVDLTSRLEGTTTMLNTVEAPDNEKGDAQESDDELDSDDETPSNPAPSPVLMVINMLWNIASLYEGRQLIDKIGVLPVLVKAMNSPNVRVRRQALRACMPIAEDIFTRYQFKQQILNDLGALGFERLKSNVVATYSDEEEVRWLSETARHIEMLPGLKVEGRDWWDNAEFPWIKLLEDNYDVILAEFKNLEATHLVSWPEKYLCTKGWDVFPFKAFNNVMEKNCQLCPKTAAIIEQIPLCTTAMFSCLQPRTHIKPHIGYQQYSERILRCHLGIRVPKGCALKVNWEDRTWEEGKCFVFDDTFRHEAWNPSDEMRVVLMLDFLYGNKDGRNPDFMKQMAEEGAGADMDALVSKDLLEAIKMFGNAQNIKEGKQEKFQ